MRDRYRSLAALGITVLLWASAFAGIRVALEAYSPGHLALFRYLVAAVALTGYAAFTRMRLPDRRDVPAIFLLGALGFAFYNVALNYGEQTVTAGAASFLVNTVPIFTALFAISFLNEHLDRWGGVGIAISFAGAALIAFGEAGGMQLAFDGGALVILLAAVAQALYFVLQKPYLKKYSPLELTTYSVWTGALLLLVFFPGLPERIRAAPVNVTMAVVYLGVFPAAVAYVTYAYALSQMDASRATSFLYLVPVVTLPIAWIWLGEIPNLLAVIGGLVALSGVVLVNRRKDRVASAERASA